MRKLTLLLGFFLATLSPLQALEVHQLTSPKGIKFWFAPDKTVPVISMNYSFENAGSAHEPAGKDGLAGMTSALLMEGAGKLDANALSEKLAELAIGIGFGAGPDYFSGSFKTTVRTKDQAIKLLKAILYKAHLPKDRLELIGKQAVASLQQAMKEPGYKLGISISETLYAGHPYGRKETVDSLTGITREDIQGFLKKNLGQSNLKVSICGNMTTKEAMEMVDSIFAALPKKVEVTALPKHDIEFSGKTIVTHQDVPQSQCRFYHPGLNVDHDNYMTLALVAQILGSGFNSRLVQEVREKNGLAYTVRTYLALNKESESLAGFVGTENAKVHEALDIIRKEYAKMASFGVTEKELKEAKQSAVGNFILRLSSTGAIAHQLLTYQEINYPASYVNERSSKIKAIKLSDVNTFIQGFFDPKKLTTFIVGNPKKEA